MLKSLREDYVITEDWTGEKYLGLTLKWDYVNRNVSVSIPGYVQAALLKFQIEASTKPQDDLHRWNQTIYGAKNQYADTNNADWMAAESTVYVQRVYGLLLYYVIAVHQKMFVFLNTIATSQAHVNTTTMGDIVRLLNYVATHPDATLQYHARDMILQISSDASYLCEERARSQDRDHFSLANWIVDNDDKPPNLFTNNGAIHTLCQIIKSVMSSVAEAKIGVTFLNTKDALLIRTTLKEIGHPQPPTTMQVDNTTAVSFSNNTIKQKQSKAICMRFYCIRDSTFQYHFNIYCSPGSNNLGDYHTKHHFPGHKQLMRSHFLYDDPNLHLANLVVMHLLWGCVNLRKMCAVHAEPGINDRRHITAVKPL